MKKIFASVLVLVILLCSFPITASAQNNIDIGDVDLDGYVTIIDATKIQLHLAKTVQFNDVQAVCGDVDGQDDINILDATYIQRFLADLYDELPYAQEFNKITDYTQKLNALQTENTITLSLMADVHYDKDMENAQEKLDAINTLGKVQRFCDIDLTCVMGDILDGKSDRESTLESMGILLDTYNRNCNTPVVVLRGNHDDNGWYSYGGYGGAYLTKQIINDEQWWDIAGANLPESFVTDINRQNGGYGYYDHEESKTRIFMLNSSDIPYIEEEDGIYRYNGYQCYAYSNEQLNFVANALQFEDKEQKNEWAALFLSHIPLDTSGLDGERFGGEHALVRGVEQMCAIIDAYRKGSVLSYSGSVNNTSSVHERAEDFRVSIDVDYTQKGRGEVIGFVSGHTHTDNYSDEVGGKNSLTYGYSYIGTVDSTTFSNLVINREDNTVSMLKYSSPVLEKDEGVVKSEVDSGSIESGEWSANYRTSFDISPKYVEMSQVYPKHYHFDDVSGIDIETLELTGAMQVKAPHVLTKAVAVKPLTAYVLPKDFSGLCLSYSRLGNKSSYMRIKDYGDYKIMITTVYTRYISFSLETGFYPDYENLYIMELHSETK